jgi:hypothetical protein
LKQHCRSGDDPKGEDHNKEQEDTGNGEDVAKRHGVALCKKSTSQLRLETLQTRFDASLITRK